MAERMTLKVAEAQSRDVGRAIARLDPKDMERIKAEVGDIIEIKGKRRAVAKAMPAYLEDRGKGIIQMDGIIRENAQIGLGEKVSIGKISHKPAERVILSPLTLMRAVRGDMRYIGSLLEGLPLREGDRIRATLFGTQRQDFKVDSTVPKEVVLIHPGTRIQIKGEVEAKEREARVTYEDIGGLEKEKQRVREMIELPLKYPQVFERLGIEPPKGVFLYGPPGCGKTLIGRALANETDAYFTHLSGPEIMHKFYGESEAHLRSIFEEAQAHAPAIIFLDELDAIAPKREELGGEKQVEKRVVAQLLALMDGLQPRGQIVVIGASNIPDVIDPALRRPGRFDREIEIGIPDKNARKAILEIHTRGMPLAEDVDLEKIASITHGFVGADLESLAREAAMCALRKIFPAIDFELEEIPYETISQLEVTMDDFREALKEVGPSAIREVFVEVPDVRWDDIGGLKKVKETLIEAVEWPLKHGELFTRAKTRPPRGILLSGAPGTGKTLLAKALARESEVNFISVKGPELISKWVGESLPFNEEILITQDGMLQRISIGELVEGGEKENIQAPTVTDNYQTRHSKVTDFIKHLAPPYLDVLVTETGREVHVTGGHSVFIKGSKGLQEIIADQVIPNETRIAVPRYIRPPETVKEVNVLGGLRGKNLALYVNNGQQYVAQAIEKLGAVKVAEIIGKEPENVYAYAKRAAMQIDAFLSLMDAADIAYDPRALEITSRYRKYSLPAVLQLDEDLATFLGLWVAEGSYMQYGVKISTSTTEAKYIVKLCKKLFAKVSVYKKPRSKGRDIIISSLPLKAFMKHVLGLPGGAEKKGVPRVILSAKKSAVAAFLRGYISGDGYFSGRYIEVNSMSRQLANDLMLLLNYFGIVARCRTKKEWTGSTSYRVRFLWSGFLKTFVEEIGFIKEKKTQAVREYISNLKLRRELQSPERHMDGDIYWDLVVAKAREGHSHPFVYDISVNPTERFIGGFGGVFVHNSERGVREVFKKARQASPSILFFDELDSLLPRRGMAGGDARVTERVISQFLSELDGIEELKGVVVLAATNRIDILDPAVLRPGRFDMILELSIPDEEERHEIFKVHTKGKPLAEDVDLKALARETKDRVGSDIEAICREASMSSVREFLRDKRKDYSKLQITARHFREAIKSVLKESPE